MNSAKHLRLHRRGFLKTTGAATGALVSGVSWITSPGCRSRAGDSDLLDVDYQALVSQADLVYQSPAEMAVEGHPLGNGTMGTLVWTSPGSIHLQINRCDVFAVDINHWGDQWDAVDYCGGCARITIDVEGRPFMPGQRFLQRTSLYDAECTIKGEGVDVRCFISSLRDLLTLEISDHRKEPQPVSVRLSMWRAPEVRTGRHLARYTFESTPDEVLVIQEFKERAHYSSSVVAATVIAEQIEVENQGETARTILASPKQGRTTVLVASSASRQPEEDPTRQAHRLLDEASTIGTEGLRKEHARWWASFWSRTFVHLTSTDDIAQFMQRVRSLHLYYMASTSRGLLPPKWNGSLFAVDGDRRKWGSQFWVWTTESAYYPLYAADAIELTEPFFRMYVAQLPNAWKAGAQRWGVEGAFYPETTAFNGPLVLPSDVAREFREIYLGRRAKERLSEKTRDWCRFDSGLRAVTATRRARYSWISHMVSSGSELAVQAWWRFRYTGDVGELRRQAYPLLRGAAEFYRNLAQKGPDGRYHILGTNQHEAFWGVHDGQLDLAAIRGTIPLAIRAAGILNLDSELSAGWQEFLDNLAPYAMGSDPESKALEGGVLAEDVWSVGHLGDVPGRHHVIGTALEWPVFPYEDWTLETRHPETDRIVHKIAELNPTRIAIREGGEFNTAVRTPISGARMGRGEELPVMMASYYQKGFAPLANGFSNFEGETAHSIEHLGILSTTLQESLLQSVSARPGEPEVISVFPAWPQQWQASFRLLARGGFLVTASRRQGEVQFIEIESRLGEKCRVRNPWKEPARLSESTGSGERVEGAVLEFATTRGGRYRLVPSGRPSPEPMKIAPGSTRGPVSYSLSLPNGKPVTATLGRSR